MFLTPGIATQSSAALQPFSRKDFTMSTFPSPCLLTGCDSPIVLQHAFWEWEATTYLFLIFFFRSDRSDLTSLCLGRSDDEPKRCSNSWHSRHLYMISTES